MDYFQEPMEISKKPHTLLAYYLMIVSLICLDFGGGAGVGVLQRLVIHFGIHKC